MKKLQNIFGMTMLGLMVWLFLVYLPALGYNVPQSNEPSLPVFNGYDEGITTTLTSSQTITVTSSITSISSTELSITEVKAQTVAKGKLVVNRYLVSKTIQLDENSDTYQAFLYEVLNDQHPELLTSEQVDAVTAYAIQSLQLKPDFETQEARIPQFVVYLPLVPHSL